MLAHGMATRSIVAAGLGAVLLWAGAATAGEPAEADALFNQGLDLMMQERYGEACPLLKRSYEADPQPGAEFTLAECYAKAGKVASALTRYQAFLATVEKLPPQERFRQLERVKVAKQQVKELEPRVASVQLKLPEGAPVGTTVRLDEVTVDQLEARQSVDPGDHRVVVEDPTGARQEQRFTVAEGQQQDVLLELPTAGPAAEEAGDGLGPTRTAALVVGGVGVASLVVFGITGGLAIGDASTVDDNCADGRCNAEGKQAADRGLVLGNVATATLVIGLAAVATGVILWVVGPDDGSASPSEPSEGEEPQEELEWASVRLTSPGLAGDPTAVTLGLRWDW